MSDTPRTDALAMSFVENVGFGDQKITPFDAQQKMWDHARQLERELAAIERETIERCAKEAESRIPFSQSGLRKQVGYFIRTMTSGTGAGK